MANRTSAISERLDRWFRRIIVEDWNLKLLALAITLALWFFVSARQSEREVLVEPRAEGKPAPTFEVKEITVTPNKIKVQGPVDRLNALDRITLPVSVEGRQESFDARGTTLPMIDSRIEALSTVNVHVTIIATGQPASKSPNVN
ncbi:MAG TPA: CdaR family protein [Pyrinomonadaceae bacterium]|nr:CdaR family protein [Pyrinomonadaceae bacterium]